MANFLKKKKLLKFIDGTEQPLAQADIAMLNFSLDSIEVRNFDETHIEIIESIALVGRRLYIYIYIYCLVTSYFQYSLKFNKFDISSNRRFCRK